MQVQRRKKESSLQRAFSKMKQFTQELKEDIFYSEDDQPAQKPERSSEVKLEELQQLENDIYKNLQVTAEESQGYHFEPRDGRDVNYSYFENCDLDDDYKETEDSSSVNSRSKFFAEDGFDNTATLKKPKRKSNYYKRQEGRKVRTAITKEKLESMNKIFKEYYEAKQAGKPQTLNLKEISVKLQLGYSTILHKYKQFRQQKEVKGGFLLEIGDARRKYKKSMAVQSLIKEAVDEVGPTNAAEISRHIFKTKKIYYSRAVICRHMLAMKEEQKGPKEEVPSEKEPNKKPFLVNQSAFEEMLKTYKEDGSIVYFHETVFATKALPENLKNYNQASRYNRKRNRDYINLTLVTVFNKNRLIFSHIKQGLLMPQQYPELIEKIGKALQNQNSMIKPAFLVVNNNQMHYDAENSKLIKESLSRFCLTKIILPPSSLNIEPLKTFMKKLKEQLVQKQKKYEILKTTIQSQIWKWSQEDIFIDF